MGCNGPYCIRCRFEPGPPDPVAVHLPEAQAPRAEGLAGRNTARLALAADVPSPILAALTGTSIDNATDWTNFVKRNWTGSIASRAQDHL
jgi:hypothetical protein